MFLTSVVNIANSSEILEKEFLESVIDYIREEKLCDWIQQPPNWVLFRTVPSNSTYCEFGTYRINLENNENELKNKMKRDHRQNIEHAINNNVIIKRGSVLLEDCIKVFSVSTAGKCIYLPKKDEIEKLLDYLPDKIHIYVAYHNTIPQSSAIYFADNSYFYAVYSAMVTSAAKGINHLLHWQAMLDAKSIGIKYYDLVGARIEPPKGSKLEGIQNFKRHLGGELVKGFLWKMPISKTNYCLCCLLTKFISFAKLKYYRGDIIDQELKRIKKMEKNILTINVKEFLGVSISICGRRENLKTIQSKSI